jgi:hypothetical protein
MFALLLTVLIAMVGLAVDVGRAHLARTALSKALDAALLAAGFSEEGGDRVAEIVRERFRANFPPRLLGIDRSRVVIDPVRVRNGLSDGNGFVVRGLSAHASAELPATFLRVLGIESIRVAVSASVQRRFVDVVMALDKSGSLGEEGLDELKQAAKGFLPIFSERMDRVALVSFGGSVEWGERLGAEPGFDRRRLEEAIDAMQLSAWTAGGPALGEAYQELNRRFINGRWRVILYFTDGAPNAIRARFDFRPCSDGARTYPGSAGVIESDGAMLAAGEADNPSPAEQLLVDGLFRPEGPSGEPAYYEGYGFDERSRIDVRDPLAPAACYDVRNRVDRLPTVDYYGTRLGPVDGVSRRPVSWVLGDGWLSFRHVINGMARNELENLAGMARNDRHPHQGITILCVGLDGKEQNLTRVNEEWGETGEEILKRLANVPESRADYRSEEPRGLYILADQPRDLARAFRIVGTFILRVTE